jgi:hypothetical protein
VELTPGDANYTPAPRLQPAVAGAIGFERIRRVVNGPPIELDDEACVRPDAVDLHPVDEDVGLRKRKAGADEKCQEALFELAFHDAQSAAYLFNDGFDGRDAGLAGITLDEIAEPERICEAELLGLPQRAS